MDCALTKSAPIAHPSWGNTDMRTSSSSSEEDFDPDSSFTAAAARSMNAFAKAEAAEAAGSQEAGRLYAVAAQELLAAAARRAPWRTVGHVASWAHGLPVPLNCCGAGGGASRATAARERVILWARGRH